MSDVSKLKERIALWTRPPGPPRVWDVVKGVRNNEKGEPVTFSIQEIPEDRHEDVVHHMSTYFIASEPLCISCNGKDDPVYVADFATLWREILKQGISVAAFVEDPNGGKPEIAGVNVLGVDFKDPEPDIDSLPLKSSNAKKVVHIVMALSKEVSVYEKYNVDKYMYAFGLSVKPSYQGQSLGAHLLRAREKIGREYQISVTSTAFTSPISQKLAHRVGFEVLYEKDYDQILDEEGNPVLPGVKVKTFKIMAKRLY